MLFCPVNGLYWECQTCTYVHNVTTRVERSVTNLARKHVDDILGGESATAGVPTVQIICEKCKHDRAYYIEKQTRSADEPSTIFYKCVECGYQWKENYLKEPLKSENIDLDIFIAGSENSTIATASKFQAAYTIVPNNPLGAKHEKGLQAIRRQLLNEVTLGTRARLPDAVTIFGSDDIVNKKFFTVMKRMMRDVENPVHILGLRDLYFMDLRTKRLMYTKGYRSFKTQLSGTLGCGRVYSWKLLDTLGWKLWDTDRERGLDQSATRNVLRKIAMIGEISHAIIGKEEGVSAIDIKTDSFAKGRNIWGFEQVLKAVGANGRFYDFVEEDLGHVLRDSFEEGTEERVGQLRAKMNAEGDAV